MEKIKAIVNFSTPKIEANISFKKQNIEATIIQSNKGKINATINMEPKVFKATINFTTPKIEAQVIPSVSGRSAYRIAVEKGFEGTEEEWLVSLKGEKGDTGTSFKIIGKVDLIDDLPSTTEIGDAYFVGLEQPYDVYVWDSLIAQFVNIGKIEGPIGPQGEQGIQGIQGLPGVIQSLIEGDNIEIDASDPAHPIINSIGGGVIIDTVQPTVDNAIWINPEEETDGFDKASTIDATTGTNDTNYMTPLKTKLAIEEFASGATAIQPDWNQTDDTKYDYIKNKPTIPDVSNFVVDASYVHTDNNFTDTYKNNIATNNAKVTNATHTGDVTGSGALTIANSAVTNTKMANMAANTIKARKTQSTGAPEDISISDLIALIKCVYHSTTAYQIQKNGTDGIGIINFKTT